MLEQSVRNALEKIRPNLEADGGGIDLVSVSEDGKVVVALTGACGSCPMSAMTMKWTVEKFLLDTVPGVVSVEQA
ncbi:MAG TPA: NifU family protein [Treponemataceae bacterium]|jgi:Fe-S cluster biogenesis protein NfuA|nr:MAG: Fe/S biogenesis protein NfuA [Spirochaetes bacterium ADurb.Bin269]TAH54718.1 MAG: NifU family protein [Treponema sp.]HOC29617.1 NifU family protein [Treponemataceae bacterium]HPX47442.1 NifU family protein [Treponemataceae bacterium]HQL32293.1 NifU family protein [Treponemataceae bacterium]